MDTLQITGVGKDIRLWPEYLRVNIDQLKFYCRLSTFMLQPTSLGPCKKVPVNFTGYLDQIWVSTPTVLIKEDDPILKHVAYADDREGGSR